MPFSKQNLKSFLSSLPRPIWLRQRLSLADLNGRESVLKKALAPLRTEFDYIIIDCPPSLGLITTNALNASDSVLIPVQCEYYALEGLSQLMSSVQAVKRRYNDRLELEGVC